MQIGVDREINKLYNRSIRCNKRIKLSNKNKMTNAIHTLLSSKAKLGGFMPSYWLAIEQNNCDRTPSEINSRVREGCDD